MRQPLELLTPTLVHIRPQQSIKATRVRFHQFMSLAAYVLGNQVLAVTLELVLLPGLGCNLGVTLGPAM